MPTSQQGLTRPWLNPFIYDIKGACDMRWEEFTAREFAEAVQGCEGVCILPIGVMERHGDHLPLGTDLYLARAMAERAAKLEPAIVFPPYFFSQIFEAKHQPGTVALPSHLLVQLLGAVCAEIARNGLKKILLLNGHGGNTNLLRYFCQTQLESQRDYAVYLIDQWGAAAEVKKALSETRFDYHGAEWETSDMLAAHPGLVKMEEARREPSAWGEGRLNHLKGIYTGIGWYANFPDHYAGDGAFGTAAKGEKALEATVSFIVEVVRSVKRDSDAIRLQNEFFDRAERPVYRNDRSDRRE